LTRLFHVSDLHFGRADQAALDWFAAKVEHERPDAVVCTGDLTQSARRREFAEACRYLEALPVPVTVEPGNHDLPIFNLIERFFSPYRRYGRLEKMVEKPLDLPNLMVVPLKTTARAQWRHNWSWGVVSRSSLGAALDLVRSASADHVTLVACHHPLVDPEGHEVSGRTIRGRMALDALAEAGAHGILTGHVHHPFDVETLIAGRTIRQIGAGTLSERLRESPPSFNEIRVGPDRKIHVEHHWLGGKPPGV
jgi:3',5'-cyclic AMP phosphodiesterase CpdA